MSLNIYVNHSSIDSPLLTSGVDWVLLDTDNDNLIFSNGSDLIKDGEVSPGESALNSAGIVLDGTEQTYPKYFLNDSDVTLLKEIFLMGDGNNRYVMGFEFDEVTTSEPILEAWDDNTRLTINSVVLGEGSPTNSWIKGITTTDGLPGVAWTGNSIAGSSDGHFLWLNNENGALTSAKTLYCQLKCTIPASQADAGASVPIIVCKYTSVD